MAVAQWPRAAAGVELNPGSQRRFVARSQLVRKLSRNPEPACLYLGTGAPALVLGLSADACESAARFGSLAARARWNTDLTPEAPSELLVAITGGRQSLRRSTRAPGAAAAERSQVPAENGRRGRRHHGRRQGDGGCCSALHSRTRCVSADVNAKNALTKSDPRLVLAARLVPISRNRRHVVDFRRRCLFASAAQRRLLARCVIQAILE